MSGRHLDQIHEVILSADGCEDCVTIGAIWVHLRLCMTCGHVGCYDSSKNKHATRHFRAFIATFSAFRYLYGRVFDDALAPS